MSDLADRSSSRTGETSADTTANLADSTPGKSTLTSVFVQRPAGGVAPSDPAVVQPIAERGVSGGGGEVPYKAQMESGFGASFSDVSFHGGSDAAAASRSIGADAYTMGNSIAMAASPTPSLVAHELAHVVQQQAGVGPSSGVGSSGDSFEQEADHAASQVASGGSSDLVSKYGGLGSGIGGSIQRKVVQRYESGEHAILGSGPSYPAGQGDLTLDPSGAQLFTGELVAFGDFYADMQQLKTAPRQEIEALTGMCRLEAVWYRARQMAAAGYGSTASSVGNQVAPGAPGGTSPLPGAPGAGAGADPGPAGTLPAAGHKPDPSALRTLPKIAGDHAVWSDPNAKCGGVQIGALRQQIHNQFTPVWSFFNISFALGELPETGVGILRATIGRRRFRGTNDSLPNANDPHPWAPGKDGKPDKDNPAAADPGNRGGDYLDLAQNNLSHFSPDNFQHWEDQHKRACDDHAKAKTDSERAMALASDSFGNHFLTDRFSTGHFVDKAELMNYATQMMVFAARSHVKGSAKKSDSQVLGDELRTAVNACFDDPNVVAQWNLGVKLALANHTITSTEASVMSSLPATTTDYSIAAMITGVLMEMPWRQYNAGAGPVEAENDGPAKNGSDGFDRSRGQGANSLDKDQKNMPKGAYQLGVGNLAALQVHDALNAIGFTVKNKMGQQWRCQGDDHLQPATEAIAHKVCDASQAQVTAGKSNPAVIKQYVPDEAWMDPKGISDYFQGEMSTAELDPTRIANLQKMVNGARIPLNVDEPHKGADAMMTKVCHSLMDILFMPSDAKTATEGDHKTGLNISMLKTFLTRRLPDMVSMAYAAASVQDIPQQALELYAPMDQAHNTLPRAANNFRWSGDQLTFDLNVTGVKPGSYNLQAKCFNKDSGYDYDSAGMPDYSVLGSKLPTDTDDQYAHPGLSVVVPAAPPNADPNKAATVPVAMVVPKHGDSALSRFYHSQGDRYVIITGDPEGKCNIGRSQVQSDGPSVTGNPAASGALPKATGADATSDPLYQGKPVGIHNKQFIWNGKQVSFRVDMKDAPSTRDQTVNVKVDTWDWELIGSNNHIAGPETVPVTIKKGSTVSEWVNFETSVDNPGDIFVKVAAGDTELGESRTQGKNTGKNDPPGPKAATRASGFVWSGKVLRFQVEPLDSDPVYVKWSNGFEVADVFSLGIYAGASSANRADTQMINVSGGAAAADSSNVSHNVSGEVYSDAACTKKIGESANRTARSSW